MADAVAIIPARGGSKRLPRKNIADFLGRPIIAYTIDAAKDSGCFDRIVVSTEDPEIAEIACNCGALVDRRAPELATDVVGLVDVCFDFLDREQRAGRDWQKMACLYATAPLRTASDVRATMALLEKGRCEFAMAVTPYDLQPHVALKLDAGGQLTPMWPELLVYRANDLPALRAGNGSTYTVFVEAFRRHRDFYGPSLRGYEMPRERSIDIDTPYDLELALWQARRQWAAAGGKDKV